MPNRIFWPPQLFLCFATINFCGYMSLWEVLYLSAQIIHTISNILVNKLNDTKTIKWLAAFALLRRPFSSQHSTVHTRSKMREKYRNMDTNKWKIDNSVECLTFTDLLKIVSISISRYLVNIVSISIEIEKLYRSITRSRP